MSRDAERARQLEAALRRNQELLEGIFDTVPIMMTIYDPNTNVLRVNRAFERLIGWSSDELASVSLMEMCYPDPEYREQAREFMQACRPEWRDFRVTTRAGGVVESSWTNVRLSDDRQLGLGIDITDRNKAEDKLRRADHFKNEFLAMLAHELRNPLAPMRIAVEILRANGVAGETPGKALSILERQVEFMVRLVDDLVDVSRISTGKIGLQRQRLDLGRVVQQAIDSSLPLLREKKQQLVFKAAAAPPLVVDGDSARLEQVFVNVLHNSVKFSPPAAVISVSVERQDGDVVVRVRDTGIGISPEILPRIFEMFVQGDRSVDRAHGGLGIGLSLVKRMVELHGGNVAASSAGADQGSEIVIRLPLSAPSPSWEAQERTAADTDVEARTSRPGSTGRRRTVLVVDDNADAASMLGKLLSTWGHEVLIANDGPSGLTLAKTHALDAIVMDIGMPGMSGYDVARLIRAEPRLDGVQLIALSGWGQREALTAADEAGFDHHLVKPPDLTALRDMLAMAANGLGTQSTR